MGIDMKISTKLVLITLSAIFILFASFVYIIRPMYESLALESYVRTLELQLKHIDYYMEEFVNDTKDDVEYLAQSRELIEHNKNLTDFLNITETGFDYAPSEDEQELVSLFERYIEANDQIEFVYFGTESGSFVMNVPIMSSGAPKDTLFNFDPRLRPWYKSALENTEKSILTNPYTAPSGYEFYLTAAHAVLDDKGDVMGVLGIDLNINNLSRYLINVRSNEPGIFGMVQDNTMIQISGKNITLTEVDMLLLDQLNYIKSNGLQYYSTLINGEETILVSQRDASLDWDYFISVPKSVIDDQVQQTIITIIVPVILYFALFIAIVIYFVEKFILDPIVNLKDTASAITETGNLEMTIKGYSHDEIGVLADSFNQMIFELKKNKQTLEEQIDKRTRELREQQLFLESLINNSPSIIFVKDIDFKYVLVNSAWCNMFNMEAESVYGKVSADVFGHDDYTHPAGDLEVIKSRAPLQMEEDLMLNDEYREFLSTKFPLFDEQGEVYAVCNIATEITDYKNTQRDLARKQEQLNVLFDTMPIGVSMISSTGEIKEANKVSEEILGISADKHKQLELSSRVFRIINTNGEAMPVENYPASRVLAGEDVVANVEMGVIQADDSVIWISTTAAAIDRESGGGVVVVFEDITEKRKSELELIRAKDEAEKAVKIKSDFLANMSHEIRTPMNAIIGLGALLEKTGLDVKQHDYVEKINRSARNLLGIINDILDFSKIEAGKLAIESINFSLDEVLGNISSVIGMKSFDKGIEFLIIKESEVPDALIGDSLRLNQVLLNLTNNAVKFTEEGEVSIRVSQTQQTDSEITLRFSVKDSGIGMTEEQKKSLFKAFSQADMSITRKYGGTGLGLAITKNLVEMMKGSIQVDSTFDQGSTFYIDIPFKYNPNAIRKSKVVPAFINDLKIAVLEDNETAIEVYEHYLVNLKYETAFFKDAQAFISDVVSNAYDLVVLDFKLKELDGIQVWNQLKDKMEDDLPSVIIVTAYGKEHVLDQAKANGIDTVLMKPITQSSLFDGIITAVKGEYVVEVSHDLDAYIEEMKPYAGNRILLVEDNPINQQVALENLENIGFAIDVADNGLEAVEMVDHSLELYDLILMDLQMPVMDGFTATVEIRSRLSADKLPIIALSADVMKETLERIEKIGIQDHVAKPIDLKDLYSKMKKQLQPKAPAKEAATKNLIQQASEIDFQSMLADFNVSAALARLGDNKLLFKKLLSGYAESYSKDLKEVIKGMQSEEMIRYFHTLKGLAGNIGAEQTQELAKDLELGLKEHVYSLGTVHETDVFESLVNKLVEDIQAITKCLESAVQEVEVEDASVMSDADYFRKLEELEELLDEYDMDSEAATNELLPEISRREGESISTKLKKSVDAYEYEEAMDYVKSILVDLHNAGKS